MKKQRATPRETAIRIVDRWLRTGIYPDHLLADVYHDRPFIADIVYGVSRWKRELDWMIDRYSRRAPTPQIRAALMTGFYQLRHSDGIPTYAAVNETVAAVQRLKPRAAGYVNSLLRSVSRDTDAIDGDLAKAPVGIRTSHPDILVRRWTARFGGHDTEALCNWNNTRPDTVLHAHPDRTTHDALLNALRDAGIDAVPHPAAPTTCIVVPAATPPASLPGYKDGWFSVRDPATSLAVERLAPQPGERVLDACAAPGGKTVLLAQTMAGRGELVAVDVSEARLSRVRANIARMGITCTALHVADAANAQDVARVAGNTPFDRILLDVPCTNTGVLRRRPDARWRFGQATLGESIRQQHAILEATAPHLAVGGRLVYSTCSLEPEEGRGIVETWLREVPGFVLEHTHATFPPQDEMDGIFIATIRRKTGLPVPADGGMLAT